ncbi:MAG: GNAT family N-acetyltransferase [Chitinophagaceae bacterium]|nr:GNAT family N-acetyltransferase [Anaerolineae bacterium]
MQIIDLATADESLCRQAAQILHEEFNQAKWGYSWPTFDEAEEEVEDLCEEGHICRAALNDQAEIIGWIGGLPEYDGNVWELHPLVVREDQRGKGIGQALVLDLEDRVRERGGLTVMLGSDDQDHMTSLGEVDLYENPWQKIATIQNYKNHPYAFYMKLGYVIIGVVPDANGIGKPDIIMGKRVAR